MNRKDIAAIRYAYKLSSLSEADLAADPITQFQNWFDEVLKAEVHEANAMTLCTVDAHGVPHGRIVLLKDISPQGFTFFTNYNSDKGQHIAANSNVSLVFFWKELERQVRITGTVQKINRAESEAYFRSRPKGSQIGAAASHQSTVLNNRDELEQRFKALELEYADKELPMPDFWGGYIVTPKRVEFWQGRDSRLHDRLRYTIDQAGAWKVERLSP